VALFHTFKIQCNLKDLMGGNNDKNPIKNIRNPLNMKISAVITITTLKTASPKLVAMKQK
jgi:hypothetical protein